MKSGMLWFFKYDIVSASTPFSLTVTLSNVSLSKADGEVEGCTYFS